MTRSGCLLCAGYGNRHDPIAHDAEPAEEDRAAAHRYDPETCRCTCGELDHPELGWVISA